MERLRRDSHRALLSTVELPAARVGQRIDELIAWWETYTARNDADVPIGLTSHVHLFELNRRLELDRGAVYGLRPALEAGAKVVIEPGTTIDLFGVPIAGLRVVRGHGGLVDGALDAPGARERALELARERGYLGA